MAVPVLLVVPLVKLALVAYQGVLYRRAITELADEGAPSDGARRRLG